MAGDAPATDAAPTGALGPCGVPEMEPNDDRDHATPITAPVMFTSCIGTPMDIDFYELTAPMDPAGGYYQFSVTNVQFGSDILAYNVSDQGEIGHIYAPTEGQDIYGYLAVAPGKKYRLSIGPFGSTNKAPTKYTFNITYTKVNDTQAPNDTADTAKMITLGTPVTAFMFSGVKTVPEKVESTADWYTVMVTGTSLTATVESLPSDLGADVYIDDPAGNETHAVSPNDGANVTVTKMDGMPGLWKVRVQQFFIQNEQFFGRADDATMVPAHFTHPYKLTVTQP
jgi:hypothetical protein